MYIQTLGVNWKYIVVHIMAEYSDIARQICDVMVDNGGRCLHGYKFVWQHLAISMVQKNLSISTIDK